MAATAEIWDQKSLDALIPNLGALKNISDFSEIATTFLDGEYATILRNPTSQALFENLAEGISHSIDGWQGSSAVWVQDSIVKYDPTLVLMSGLAAFHAFLQANVTGPPLDLRDIFSREDSSTLSEQYLKSLDMDGVSVYQHIPHVELFCLARLIFTTYFPRIFQGNYVDCKWMRLRVNAYHHRLLSGVSGGRLMDTTGLQNIIEKDLKELQDEILAPNSPFSTEAKVQFLLEKAQIHIMQGLGMKAKDDLKMAKTESKFTYALSGALGKRTKFQQNDTSQLVVFAKSHEANGFTKTPSPDTTVESRGSGGGQYSNSTGPESLDLNDDTLLESIKFSELAPSKDDITTLPPPLAGMRPDEQPQLKPLDQIVLLTEATLKDVLTPFDGLNSEEVLPYAVRVLLDKPTNWQIYTQALLVRSRIESHRSRTQERSVLQMQAIVDQIIADTQDEATPTNDVPEIRVTQFLPRAQASESATAPERLNYIFQLNTPAKWELETELAFAWSSVGSFISALEIFKRLKLWAEVALCYHSVDQSDKARQIIRRQLFYSSKGPGEDKFDVDATEIAGEKWDGDMRSPPPPHAPRLWCILGDLDSNPEFWNRAWEISNHRYARAQRTLGEYWARNCDLEKAREAYLKATVVNRQNNDSWSRLGDIDLRVGNWDGAIIAFQQSIMIDDTDAKTYSNLGSALLSKHAELIKLQKIAAAVGEERKSTETKTQDDDEEEASLTQENKETPQDILRQALAAYKRGATIAYDNWRIWDNVLTIASRMSPPAFPDIVNAARNVIRIRAPTVGEAAVDVEILRALTAEVTSRDRGEIDSSAGIYIPPRGSLARAVIQMMESDVIPLITTRAELWTLSEKLAFYCRDYSRALSCAEKAWRMVTQSADEGWLTDRAKWKQVVGVTDDLVSAYENYGAMEKEGGELVEKAWRMKARSAVRGVMGRAKDSWEDSEEWGVLKGLLEGLKS